MEKTDKYKDIVLGFEFEVNTPYWDDVYNFVDEMVPITNCPQHTINSYHSTMNETIAGRWRVEDDPSISGAEFISPPMPYVEAKNMVKEVFKIMQNSKNIRIDKECGLHVGISINGNVDNLDLSGFLYSLNQNYITSLWPDRITNTYVKNIKSQLKLFGKKELMNLNANNFAEYLLRAYHSFISLKKFGKLENEYLEIRVPGGENYHLKFDKLFALIDHVADKMLLNNSKTPKLNNKSLKKMVSYVNRALQKSDRPGEWTHRMIIGKLKAKTSLFENTLRMLLETTTNKIMLTKIRLKNPYNNHKNIIKELNIYLNEYHYIYLLIRYCILHEKSYNSKTTTTKIKNLLEQLKDTDITIDIIKNDSVFNKIALFKHWADLPSQLTTSLLKSVNIKTYSYLAKYVSDGILYAKNEQKEYSND